MLVVTRLACAFLLALVLAGCTANSPTPRPLRGAELARAVDSIALPLIASGSVLGLSIAVVRGDSVLLARGYGHADLARTVRCDEHTAFWIASVTKTFTAAILIRLAEDGVLDLDRTLTEYVPEAGVHWKEVSLAHALSHTSGIPDFTIEADERAQRENVAISREYTAAWARRARPAYSPGERWSYCNTAFWLAGMAAESASRAPFHSLLEREIVRPLGLTRTGFGFSDRMRGQWRVFRADRDSLEDFDLINDYPVFTDGGLASTALEVAAVLRGVYGGRLLDPESVERMTRPTATSRGLVDYGLGTRRGALGGHPKLGHTGGYLGTLAAAAYYAQDSLAVVVLLNTDGGPDAPSIEAKVVRLALGISAPDMREVPLTEEQLALLTGMFEMDAEGEVRRYERRVERGKLFERRIAEGAEPYELLHLGGGEFTVAGWDEARLVSPLEDPSDVVVETWGGFFGAIAYRAR